MAALLHHRFVLKPLRFLLLAILRIFRLDYDVENTAGIIDLLQILTCHLVIAFGRTQRFPTYDYSKSDPYNRGYLPREEETKLECAVPSDVLDSEESAQELLLTGVRTSGEVLVIRFVRAQYQQAQITILLKDTNGVTFTTKEEFSPRDISQGHKFQAGGLRIQCIEPMRKWRFAFNGLLICQDYLDAFEQTGYCVGTVQISGSQGHTNDKREQQEQELHLRGNFMRIRHPNPMSKRALKLSDYTHHFIYTKKGHMLQLSSLNFDNGNNLIFGSFLSTSGFKDPVETIFNDQGLEAKFEDILHSPTLTFSTCLSLASHHSQTDQNIEICISSFDAMLDNVPAVGLSLQGFVAGIRSDHRLKPAVDILHYEEYEDDDTSPPPFVLSLFDSRCKNRSIAGGKGASLAVLTDLSFAEHTDYIFNVPEGIVVTTAAFRRFMQSPAMYSMKKQLDKVLEANTVEDVKQITNECMNAVIQDRVPSCVSKEIFESLLKMSPSFAKTRFAVRSSCASEDSEDMSAAGQMETFLGVEGKHQILQAILKCWASQFSHVAIEYKKRYGQELVSEMAVIIMQMVSADSAGVMFTCDPLNGDPSSICISSNFGLGESIVSALADPDTMRVHRDINGNLTLGQPTVGKKEVKVVMDKDGDVTVVKNRDALALSLKPSQVELLATVGSKIERCYGDWRDVEWAYEGEALYILQARPVTSIDRPSDFEISTDFELSSTAESSCFSKANVGEVLNGASSPLSIKLVNGVLSINSLRERTRSARKIRCSVSPYLNHGLKIARYHYFLDLSEVFRLMLPNASSRVQIESIMLNMCGRIIDDPEFLDDMLDETDLPPHYSYWSTTCSRIKMEYLSGLWLRYNKYLAHRRSRYPQSNMSAEALFQGFIDSANVVSDYGFLVHKNASGGSSQWSSHIFKCLQDVTDESAETIYGDVSRLLSSADDVVSADVPKQLKHLGQVVSDEIGRNTFTSCSSKDAEMLLRDERLYPKSAAMFQECIKQFGHRGYNEIDIYRKTWDMDASPLIVTLQTMLRNELDDSEKKRESIWQSIQTLECKLTLWQKIRLAVIVKFARKAVGIRENTKSFWVWTQNVTRKWAWALAHKMKQEGRLPDEELLFFCTISEIHTLIRDRNPAIIARAFDRKKLFPDLVKQEFLEYYRGTPRPNPEAVPVFDDGVVQLKGFPISKGKIQAKARVINRLEDASQIQKGEILITYATDIGWSPYFPLLGGVVTELGGLMSHGAVVAREYGLPCVVGVLGATKVFRSGDTVLLDGVQGLLVRIEQAA